jgi:hypothetical protein
MGKRKFVTALKAGKKKVSPAEENPARDTTIVCENYRV